MSSLRASAGLVAGLLVICVTSGPAQASTAPDLPRAGAVVDATTVKAGSTARVGAVLLALGETSRIQSTGWVTVTNPGKKPASVKVHEVEIVGPDIPAGIVGPDIPADIVGPDRLAVVGAGQSVVLPVGIVGPDRPSGKVVTAVDVSSSAQVSVSAGAVSALGLPVSGSPLPWGSATATKQVPLGSTPSVVLETEAQSAIDSDALAQGWVSVSTTGRKAGLVTLQYVMDGTVMGSVEGIVGPDRPTTLPVGLLCDGFRGAPHTFQVRLSTGAADVSFESGALSVVGLPRTGEMPHAAAGLEAKATLGSVPQTVLHADLDAAGTSNDVWMGGWATVANTSAKAVRVSLQSQMGTEAEGPALVVTVPARTTLSVPFGIQCNGEPGGATSLDLAATSTAPVTVTAGEIQGWSLASG